jgi:adenine-specific DNA-methyltransferase
MSTLNYIGSKKTLLPFLDYVISAEINTKHLKKVSFLDGFAGSGVVGKYFSKKYGYTIFANDLELYSYTIAYALLKVQYSNKLEKLIEELDKLEKPKKYNLLTKYYSDKGETKRLFWTSTNTEKTDAIIESLQDKLEKQEITKDEYMFLLASLLSVLDKTANTASVYGAFLKKYKKSALTLLKLKPIHTDEKINEHNKIYNLDINSSVITDIETDIVYLDPPYNTRQYAKNYHPLNFVAKYDSNVKPYGVSGMLENTNKSEYSIKQNVKETFTNLIKNLKTKYILLSYNDEGLMNSQTIKEILTTKGKTTLYKYKYKKFKSQKDKPNEKKHVYEYLYLCCVGIEGEFETYICSLENEKFEKTKE